jgi:hypothetical protein
MRTNLVLIAFLLVFVDSRLPDPQMQAVAGQGKVWMLEEKDSVEQSINLMNSGDYSGCTIVREIPEPGELTATGDRNYPAPGIIRAVIKIRNFGSDNLDSALKKS